MAQYVNDSAFRDKFARDFLAGLQLPVTKNRMQFMLAWQAGENTKATWNPLATTENMKAVDPGQTNFNYNNNFPVKNYTSYEVGLRANLKTVQNGYYPEIMRYLKNDLSVTNPTPELIKNLQLWGTGYNVINIARTRQFIIDLQEFGKKYWYPALLIGTGITLITFSIWQSKKKSFSIG